MAQERHQDRPVVLAVNVSEDLASRLDAYIAAKERQHPGWLLKRTSVLRQALEAFLAADAAAK